MPDLTLRDVPRELHRWLKQQAEAHHRSVNKEVVALLEDLRAGTPPPARKPSVEALKEISRQCAALPDLDQRSPEEIIGYDERGLPA
jgi:plasmid stability protein